MIEKNFIAQNETLSRTEEIKFGRINNEVNMV